MRARRALDDELPGLRRGRSSRIVCPPEPLQHSQMSPDAHRMGQLLVPVLLRTYVSQSDWIGWLGDIEGRGTHRDILTARVIGNVLDRLPVIM